MSELPADHATAALDQLERDGGPALLALAGEDLAAAWLRATADLREQIPDAVRQQLVRSSGLSAEGLAAALDVVVAGVRTDACRSLLAETPPPPAPLPPALAILPSNVPGLALQCLLPALAARRPLLIKPSSAETTFTPFFLQRLVGIEPRLATALASATWRGGDRSVEDAVLERAGRVVAYGGDGALTDLRARTTGRRKLTVHGHRISLALVVPENAGDLPGGELRRTADALARDVALFDQRGCLSVHAVLVLDPSGELAAPLADELSEALHRAAGRWPPGAAPPGAVAAVRALRDEAVMAGARVADLPLRSGTVIQVPAGGVAPLESPGLRSVRVVPSDTVDELLERLEPWRGRLQGLALGAPRAGLDPALGRSLESLGISRIAAAGELQAVDAALWHNGGLSPLEAYSR